MFNYAPEPACLYLLLSTPSSLCACASVRVLEQELMKTSWHCLQHSEIRVTSVKRISPCSGCYTTKLLVKNFIFVSSHLQYQRKCTGYFGGLRTCWPVHNSSIFSPKSLFMCCTVYLGDYHYSFKKHTLLLSLTRDSFDVVCYCRSVDAFLWVHKCVHVCAGMLTGLWGGILLEEWEQLLLPIKLQQTIIVFGPNLVVPHPSINLISSGQLTWRMCCAVLPKHSP